MSFTTVKIKLARVIDNLNKERAKNAAIYGEELIALVNDRLESKGEGSDGEKFPLYSKKPLSMANAIKVIQQSNRPSAAKNLKPGQTSYDDIRKVLGLPTDRRTHVFTGDMLKSISAYITENSESVTVVEIRPKDSENQLKLNSNSFRMFTNLLSPNDKEVEFLNEVNRQRLNSAIND